LTRFYVCIAHPDHLGGFDTLVAQWPSIPIYIGVRGVLDGMNYFTPAAAYLNNVEILNKDLSYWGSGSVINVVDMPSMETSYAAMLYLNIYGKKMLLTGDVFMPRSHLYVSNSLNGWGTYPYVDDALCQWATELISLQCTLDDDISLFAGHGPASSDYEETSGLSWQESMMEQVNWIRDFRQVAYNTCNASYGMDQMVEKYPSFGFTDVVYGSYGLINWFPQAANAVGCSCSSSGTTSGPYTIYTPNNCGTSPSSIPRCGILDNSYSLDTQCAMLGVSSQTAYLSETSYDTSSGNNYDAFSEANGKILLGVSAATLALAALLMIMSFVNLIRTPKAALAKQGEDSKL
jgi:hypothetical protein